MLVHVYEDVLLFFIYHVFEGEVLWLQCTSLLNTTAMSWKAPRASCGLGGFFVQSLLRGSAERVIQTRSFVLIKVDHGDPESYTALLQQSEPLTQEALRIPRVGPHF